MSAGGDPREHQFMSGEKGRKKPKRQDVEPVTTVGNWDSVFQETSGRECPTFLSYFN